MSDSTALCSLESLSSHHCWIYRCLFLSYNSSVLQHCWCNAVHLLQELFSGVEGLWKGTANTLRLECIFTVQVCSFNHFQSGYLHILLQRGFLIDFDSCSFYMWFNTDRSSICSPTCESNKMQVIEKLF